MNASLKNYALTLAVTLALCPALLAQQSSQPQENTQNPQSGAPTNRNAPGRTKQNETNPNTDRSRRNDAQTNQNKQSGAGAAADHQNHPQGHQQNNQQNDRQNNQTQTSGAQSGGQASADYKANFDKGDAKEAREQSEKAAKVLNDIMDKPDSNVPEWLFDKAECVAVFPSVVKAAFIVGGRGGKGIVTCRDPQTRQWMQPAFLKIGGGSFGAQIGVSSTDLVLFGMNRDSADAFFKDRLELGGEAAVAAGPVGRSVSASTDAPTISSQFLSYSRSKGLFAGVSLQGAVITQDEDLNRAVYGPDFTAAGSMKSMRTTPSEVAPFTTAVSKYSAGAKK
jgi:SH3 domain-containing YSC84-like protein 1